jgi:GAF domain-containing protein
MATGRPALEPDDFTAALARAARSINRPSTTEETLSAIATAARDTVPGFDQVGISLMHRDGTIETKAYTGDLVPALDKLQYELQEGPCVSSLFEDPMLVVDRIKDDVRWPKFVPQAVQLGLKSQMALRLYLDDDGTIGGINLYSTESEEIDPHAPHVAELFAAQAAAALGQVRRSEQLSEALTSRQIIGQATGILIERYKLDDQRAFGFLVRLSSQSNTKLRTIAERVVADAISKAEKP